MLPAVEVWEGGARIGTLAGDEGPEGDIWCLTAFTLSAGACRLATGDAVGMLRLYDGEVLGGQPLQSVQVFNGLFQHMLCYHEPEEGRPRLVAGSHDGLLWVRDGESLQTLRDLQAMEGFIWGLQHFIAEDGHSPRIVVGSSTGDLRMYDPEEGILLHRLGGHQACVRGLACVAAGPPPGRPIIVSGNEEPDCQVWDGETGRGLGGLRDGGMQINAIVAYKEPKAGRDRVAAGDWSGDVIVFDLLSRERVHVLRDRSAVVDLLRRVARADPSAEGIVGMVAYELLEGASRLACAALSGLIRVWDPEGGHLLHRLRSHDNRVWSMRLVEHEGHHHMISGDGNGQVAVWNMGEAPASDSGLPLRAANKTG
jgi:WD40 repeat protein